MWLSQKLINRIMLREKLMINVSMNKTFTANLWQDKRMKLFNNYGQLVAREKYKR